VLEDFVDRLVQDREKNGGGEPEEILNTLIASRNSGLITPMEMKDMLAFLFIAGFDTSKNQLTFLMRMMLNNPDKWARCAEDRPYCDKVVEEMLRHTSIVNTYRLVREEMVYRDVRFTKDEMLVLPTSLAGRDPSAFKEPMAFDPERREPNRHIAFGRGAHMCLGQHLARAQIEEGVHLIAQRITKPKLAGEITWRPFPGAWGMRTLPITFTPAPRRTAPNEKAA
jgi:cytochrome P450